MATLCVEGNVQPSEFLHVLEYDEAVHLATVVTRRVSATEERYADLHGALVEGQIKQAGQIVRSIDNLGKAINNALRG